MSIMCNGDFHPRERIPTLGYRLKLFLKIYWKTLVVIFTPIILLPLPLLTPTPDYKCMYIVLLVAVYWITEALPLPVTSMIPIVLLPLLGVLSSDRTCEAYMRETNILFLGGLMIATGIQHSKLPKRLALKTIQLVGCSHIRLNFGLSFVTMAISMWISNAAATTMMLPIVDGVLEVFEQQGLGDRFKKNEETDIEKSGKEVEQDDRDVPVPTDTTLCYYLSIAYSSTIGGIGTIVGTVTNATFKGIYESRFPDAPPIDFLQWMMFNIPLMLIMEILTCISLYVLYFGMFRPNSKAAKSIIISEEAALTMKRIINEQYQELGPMTFYEKTSAVMFFLVIFLYIFRSPGFCVGWADVLTDLPAKDGVATIIVVLLMFIVPMSPDFIKVFTSNSCDEMPTRASPGIITWNLCREKVPWGLMFLLGSGFALAEGSRESRMSRLIGESLTVLECLPPALILFLVVLVAELITEFTVNAAIASILLPVLSELAIAVKVHPMYLMMPAALACSMAFHMPAGTPPNTIVAGVANIRTSQMAIGGIGPTIITTLLIWGAFPTWGRLIYPDTTSLPYWTMD